MKAANQLQQKLVVTLMILILARLGIFIPIPGIDHNSLDNTLNQNGLINFLNIFSGGGFSTIGIFALGIVPYINASIIMQLLTKIIPELENLQKEEGESGRQKIIQITRYFTLIWAIIQSIGISLWIKPYVFNWNYYFILDCIIALTTGSMIIMWCSEFITEYGIGNGPSLLIFQNIISGIPKSLQNYKLDIYNKDTITIGSLFFIVFVLTLIINVLIQEGKRKVTIVSARQLGKINELNPQSYIPLKLNQGGVMPIVFASATMTLPIYVTQNIRASILNNIIYLFLPGHILYFPAYGLLIIGFSYFYASLVLNPEDIAENLKKMGASIPSIRPGSNTIIYFKQILNRLTLIGGLCLFAIALIPSLIAQITNINLLQGLGTTSLLILVGVAIDTAKQIQTYIISQQYDNIME
uniref:Protein translocase subunit SecY n=2 Tax=Gracilariopsis TaxID=2781 RepID=A0A1C9CF84_9FLOR|nr:preprotein translocase subunit SecY [Gracilariopsis lemaneiformis]YP_009294783.1 preprotein translocase subunit SecY [Gracilariopsis chorda]AJO68424.1 preprotein translocase subunit SecY [Gracilariopsis lemaneiformis]AML79927.1 preprotein translocase subunit SecY [Gracilariopsis lemaneiformis]AOM67043.1 preprotein translocase subunit SecY [Gracilariopsis chorda]